jgi:hypothetical protein
MIDFPLLVYIVLVVGLLLCGSVKHRYTRVGDYGIDLEPFLFVISTLALVMVVAFAHLALIATFGGKVVWWYGGNAQ